MNFPNYFFPHKHPQLLFLPIPSERHEGDGNRAAGAGTAARRVARDAPAAGQIGPSRALAHAAGAGLVLGPDKGISALGPPARNGLQPQCKLLGAGTTFPCLSPNQFWFSDPSGEITALSPAPAGGREVPVPADGAAFITEGRVTPKAGSTFYHPGAWAARDPVSGEEEAFGLTSPAEAGTGAGSPKVCSGAIPCSPPRRRWPRWRRQGRGAPASADKGRT